MPKIIRYEADARARLKLGVDKLANAVKVTLGPRGRNVAIGKTFGGSDDYKRRRYCCQGDRAGR